MPISAEDRLRAYACFGKILRCCRRHVGKTRMDIANETCLTDETVRAAERGIEDGFSLTAIAAYCYAVNTDPFAVMNVGCKAAAQEWDAAKIERHVRSEIEPGTYAPPESRKDT